MINLTEAYNQVSESSINKLNFLIKNGVIICGFIFDVQIKDEEGTSSINPKNKNIVIKLKDIDLNSEAATQKILKIIDLIKIKYLRDVVITPTVKQYSELMDIANLLKEIKIVPILQNDARVLAACKIHDDNSYTLSFSTRLTTKLKPLVEYIVIHELCHAKLGKEGRGHTKEFWNLLKEYSPHYKDFAEFLNSSADFID